MTLADLGNLGEFVGSIGVIVSLVYVGLQIRQNNALSRASTIYANNAFYSNVFAPVASDKELAQIYRKANDGEDLEPDEFVRYAAFLRTYLAMLENAYEQQKSGLYAVQMDAHNIVKFLSPEYSKLFCSPQAKKWLLNEAKRIYAPDVHEQIMKYLDLNETEVK